MPTLYFLSPVHRDSRDETGTRSDPHREPAYYKINKLCTVQVCINNVQGTYMYVNTYIWIY